MAETILTNPEDLSAHDTSLLLLGSLALIRDEGFPAEDYAWHNGNRHARDVTSFYEGVDLTASPYKLVLGMPAFYTDLDPDEIRGLEDLEELPAPTPDYFLEDGNSSKYHSTWMKAMVGIKAYTRAFPPITYELHASPKHTGYARTSPGVLTAHAETYDQRSTFTPVGYAEPFAELLTPIIEHGKTV